MYFPSKVILEDQEFQTNAGEASEDCSSSCDCSANMADLKAGGEGSRKWTTSVLIQAVVFEGFLMLVKNYWELKLGREYIHLVVGIDGEGSLNFL